MKICPKCNAQIPDEVNFCSYCGNPLQAPQQQYYTGAMPMYDPYDHTAEFDSKDISDNKVYCMLVYLMGWIGILIALLAAPQSPYTAFHLRQALKFNVMFALAEITAVLLCWTFVLPIVAVIYLVVLWIVQINCFFQVCNGKAKEPAIIRTIEFLK